MRIFLFLCALVISSNAVSSDSDVVEYIQSVTKLHPAASGVMHSYALVHSIECKSQPTLEDLKMFYGSRVYKILLAGSTTTPLGLASVRKVFTKAKYKINCEADE